MKNPTMRQFPSITSSLFFTVIILLLSGPVINASSEIPASTCSATPALPEKPRPTVSLQELKKEQEALIEAIKKAIPSIIKNLEDCKIHGKESGCSNGFIDCFWFIDRLKDITERLKHKIKEKQEATKEIKDQIKKQKIEIKQANLNLNC